MNKSLLLYGVMLALRLSELHAGELKLDSNSTARLQNLCVRSDKQGSGVAAIPTGFQTTRARYIIFSGKDRIGDLDRVTHRDATDALIAIKNRLRVEIDWLFGKYELDTNELICVSDGGLAQYRTTFIENGISGTLEVVRSDSDYMVFNDDESAQ